MIIPGCYYIQLLYSRLLMCKERGAALAAEGHASLRSNPVAVELGLEEPVNAQSVLAQSIEMMGAHAIAASTSIMRPSSRSPVPPGNTTTATSVNGVGPSAEGAPASSSSSEVPNNKPIEGEQQQQQQQGNEHDPGRNLLPDPDGGSSVIMEEMPGRANVVYMYLLEKCEKVFSNEMDQATFEEHMRWFFGTKVSRTRFVSSKPLYKSSPSPLPFSVPFGLSSRRQGGHDFVHAATGICRSPAGIEPPFVSFIHLSFIHPFISLYLKLSPSCILIG
jgi:hypothetical protein